MTGIGWERQGDSPAVPGQPVRGVVYFTFNGKRLAATLEDVAGGMWPVVHIQKKVCTDFLRVNFHKICHKCEQKNPFIIRPLP